MLWSNGAIDPTLADNCVYFHQHAFNVGQHVAHNAMIDECVQLGITWHIRVDDDCWMKTKAWHRRLMSVMENVKKLRGKYPVLGIRVDGLNNPPQTIAVASDGQQRARLLEFKVGNEKVEAVEIVGGIFRMSHMSLLRYFRWDERQAMGFGDATQFKSLCESTGTDMLRVASVRCTHGESTNKQNEANPSWSHEHDMLQYVPLGL